MRHYFSRRELEAFGEPIGDMSRATVAGGRIMHGGGKGSQPPPPDYTPVAKASEESARLAADLGREQLAEGRRQYENNVATAKPVVDAQLQLMQQGIQQGNDYYEYGKSFRNVEQEMQKSLTGQSATDRDKADQAKVDELTNISRGNANTQKVRGEEFTAAGLADAGELRGLSNAYTSAGLAESNQLKNLSAQYTSAGLADSAKLSGLSADHIQAGAMDAADLKALSEEYTRAGIAGAGVLRDRVAGYERDVGADISLFTGGNSGIYNKYKDDIENEVGTAMSDARTGQANAYNDALRQSMRYGIDPASLVGSMTSQGASAIAAAANNTRTGAVGNYRGVIGQGVNLKGDVFRGSQSAMENALTAEQAARSGGFEMRGAAINVGSKARGEGFEMLSTANDASSKARSGGFQMHTVATDDANKVRSGGFTMLGDSQNAASKARTVGYGMTADGMTKQENAAMTNYNLGDKNKALSWARQLDVTGMARGMPGASQGAYSLANQSGNSAVANQGAAGNSLMSSMGAGASTIMNGRSLYQQGLGSILNSQSSLYGDSLKSGGGGLGDIATIVGAGAKLFGPSDRRLKENIELVGVENGHNIYTFNYISRPETRYQGVMADEVAGILPEAVIYGADGMAAVNYGLIGVDFKEI